MLYRNVFPVRLEVGLEVPICNRKSGRSKHSWGKHFPVVRDSIGEGPGGRNVIVTRIEFQPRDEFQFLPRGFAFRHLACRSDNFCLTLSFFLSRKINPVLKKEELLAVGTFSYAHLRILPFPATHAFSSLSSRLNWRHVNVISTRSAVNGHLALDGRSGGRLRNEIAGY